MMSLTVHWTCMNFLVVTSACIAATTQCQYCSAVNDLVRDQTAGSNTNNFIMIINVLIKVTFNVTCCRGILQSIVKLADK